MLYRVSFADGSSELLEVADISDAREKAEELYEEAPVRRVEVVMDDDLETPDDTETVPSSNENRTDE